MALPIYQVDLQRENDVVNLFSHLGDLTTSSRYKECMRDVLATEAGRRWPLLVELRGGASMQTVQAAQIAQAAQFDKVK